MAKPRRRSASPSSTAKACWSASLPRRKRPRSQIGMRVSSSKASPCCASARWYCCFFSTWSYWRNAWLVASMPCALRSPTVSPPGRGPKLPVRRGGGQSRRRSDLEYLKTRRAAQDERSWGKGHRVGCFEGGLPWPVEGAGARAHEQEPQVLRFSELHRAGLIEAEHAGGGAPTARGSQSEVARRHTRSQRLLRATIGHGMQEPLTLASAIGRAFG